MAGRDGITDGTREMQMVLQATGQAVNVVASVSQILIKTMELHQQNPVAKQMAKLLKEGKAVGLETDSIAEAYELQRRMKEQGIKPTIVVERKGEDGTTKGFVVVDKGSAKEAQEIIDNYYNNISKGGIVTDEQLRAHSGGNVQEITGLDEATALYFVSRCEQQNVPVSMVGPSNGEYRLRFAEKDLDKIDRIRVDVAFDMSSEMQKPLREQMEWKNQYRTTLMNSLINGKTPDDKPLEVGSAVVSTDGKYIEVRKMDILMVDGDERRRIPRNGDSQKLSANVKEFVSNMEEPVLVSKTQYQEFQTLSHQERTDYLREREREDTVLSNGRPVLSEEDMRAIAKAEAQRQTVEVQMEADGIELPTTRYISYDDAASLWGLSTGEADTFSKIHSEVQAEYRVENVEDIVEATEQRHSNFEPKRMEIPFEAEMKSDQIFERDEHEFTFDNAHGWDEPDFFDQYDL